MFNEEKIKSFSTTDMRIYNYILKHSIQFPYIVKPQTLPIIKTNKTAN